LGERLAGRGERLPLRGLAHGVFSYYGAAWMSTGLILQR
jgi:hypothetical protein